MKTNPFRSIGADFPASIVVLLVAIPLCLGIALGSNAPLFSGLIAGIVGGVVIGILSGSQLSVSGPAAGLTVIVAGGIATLPSWEAFLMAVVLAGVFQIIFGSIRAGIIGDYVPNAVIKGMLAAIGIILILKQLPHLVGYDEDFLGDESFQQADHENTFSELIHMMGALQMGAVLVGILSMLVLIIWERPFMKKMSWSKLVPGPLVAVLVGTFAHLILRNTGSAHSIQPEHLVQIPVASSFTGFIGLFSSPDFSSIALSEVWVLAITLALVASLETLLSIEAVDKIDPHKRITPPNRELLAQGAGNMLSGLIGGLPVTSVIVRSSANVNSGGETKLSAILHGVMLFLCVALIPGVLNNIPLASLAAILIFTGYKLAKITLFREFWSKGMDQFVPFVVTIVAILFTDLLIGVCIGIGISIIFLLRTNFHSAIMIVHDGDNYLLRFRKSVSFLNKPLIKKELRKIPSNSHLIIDTAMSDFIDMDVIDTVNEFLVSARDRNITVSMDKHGQRRSQAFFQTNDN
ncbi:MAG: SulP family inorganic anion transporter [Chitinophagales bacterium]|nr:SulP family inorganic anion transporter [Chitinophagales bacterium]HAE14028.1 hypothetical protein [Bacteroidota bacterium]MCB9019414.1 SulP family inorganic anion transporter [Chitinophagales bacterium]MCB9022262.1 SulP family inorganic anion transporter [Chitinophagales bacterium]HPE98722.1 SulP family inorganic anion transporter [Chitinophagales bacterium]